MVFYIPYCVFNEDGRISITILFPTAPLHRYIFWTCYVLLMNLPTFKFCHAGNNWWTTNDLKLYEILLSGQSTICNIVIMKYYCINIEQKKVVILGSLYNWESAKLEGGICRLGNMNRGMISINMNALLNKHVEPAVWA